MRGWAAGEQVEKRFHQQDASGTDVLFDGRKGWGSVSSRADAVEADQGDIGGSLVPKFPKCPCRTQRQRVTGREDGVAIGVRL